MNARRQDLKLRDGAALNRPSPAIVPAHATVPHGKDSLPYDDPHLAWLVSTYLNTSEGAAIAAAQTSSLFASEPSEAPSEAPMEWEGEAVTDIDTTTPSSDDQTSNRLATRSPATSMWRGALLGLLIVVSSISVLVVWLTIAEPPPVSATVPNLVREPMSFPVSTLCPFMGVPTTIVVKALTVSQAVSATAQALPNCTVEAGMFDQRMTRR